MIAEGLRNKLIVKRAGLHPEHELLDLCAHIDHLESTGRVGTWMGGAAITSADWKDARLAPEGATVIGGGKVLRDVPGMGKVYDWRRTAWTASMDHGPINPILGIVHIPVVPNMAGIADFVRLRDVLVAQGLGVQTATDSTGNVALYTDLNRMCYQARGANQFSWGTENMHLSVGEAWTKHQLRAQAWIINQSLDRFSIPTTWAELIPGYHLCGVKKRGITTHQREAIAAEWYDRSDPGPGYDHEYVRHAIRWYRDHNASFVGA